MMIGAFIVRYVLSVGFAQCPFIISIGTPAAYMANAMGLFSAGSSIGGAISPTVLNFLSELFFEGSAAGCCYSAAIICVIVAVILFATRYQAKVMDKAALPAA